MFMAAQFPETAASVDCRRRCTSLRCSCGFPAPLPFLEWTGPSASPAVLPSTSPSEETPAFSARRSPSCQPPPRRNARAVAHCCGYLGSQRFGSCFLRFISALGTGRPDGVNQGIPAAEPERSRTGRRLANVELHWTGEPSAHHQGSPVGSVGHRSSGGQTHAAGREPGAVSGGTVRSMVAG